MTLNKFEQYLQVAKSLSELDKALKDYLHSWQISGFTFSYFSPRPQKNKKLYHEVCSKRMETWHQYYYEQCFDEVDQTKSEATKAMIPVFWDTHDQWLSAKTKKDKKMRKESIDFGVTIGLSIPIHGPDNDYAELTLRQFKEETCLNNWQQNKYEWQLAALYYYHHLRFFLLCEEVSDPNMHLTARERQCLHLLTQNYSTLEIAKALKMTERTVNFHIQNINCKLGTRNKYQSIAKVKATKI